MKHLKSLCKVILGIYLCFALIVYAADSLPVPQVSITKDDLTAQKELLQIQIDSKKELLQKDIEALNKRIDDQANRVGDIGSSVNLFGIIAGVMGTLITVLIVVIGLWGYKTAKRDAEQIAKDASQKWFEENNRKLNARLEELESKAGDAIKNIDTHAQSVRESSDLAKAAIQSLQESMWQEILGQKSALQQTTVPLVVEQRAEELKKLPEDSYSFDDWNTRAFAAYNENKMEDAIFYWEKAAGMRAAGALKTVQVMFNRGLILAKLNRTEEAIAAFDTLIQRFGDASETELRKPVAQAMFNKGFALSGLKRYEEAIVSYDALIQKFGEASEIELVKAVSGAMACKGFCLGQLKRNEEVITTSDLLIQKFDKSQDLEIQENIAMTMCNKAIAFGQLNRYKEAIDAVDVLIQNFDAASEDQIRKQIARAMKNKSVALKLLKREEDAIENNNTLIKKFENSSVMEIREIVFNAMNENGFLFGQLNQADQAVAMYDELIQKLEKTSETELLRQLAYAKNGKGFNLFCRAKAMWEQPVEARKLLEQAKKLFNQSLDIRNNNGFFRGNLAYTLWLLDDLVRAEQHFREGLGAQESGGEELYKGTLNDFNIHPITPDKGFKELVERLWLEYQLSQKP